MYSRFTQLSFIIGLFFTIVSLILFANMIMNKGFSGLNIYTVISFLLFGICMMLVRAKREE